MQQTMQETTLGNAVLDADVDVQRITMNTAAFRANAGITMWRPCTTHARVAWRTRAVMIHDTRVPLFPRTVVEWYTRAEFVPKPEETEAGLVERKALRRHLGGVLRKAVRLQLRDLSGNRRVHGQRHMNAKIHVSVLKMNHQKTVEHVAVPMICQHNQKLLSHNVM